MVFSSKKRPRAFTLVELLVVIAIIGVMVGLLLPAVQAARETARRMACSNNMKQFGLALHNYHGAFNMLPRQGGGTWGMSTATGNRHRRSAFVPLLPFLEQQPLWDQISGPLGIYPPMGPAPFNTNYEPWRTQVPTFLCPSDGSAIGTTAIASANYGFCVGDGFWQSSNARNSPLDNPPDASTFQGQQRGMFIDQHDTGFRDCLDGLSNTIAMGEIARSRAAREIIGDLAALTGNSFRDNPKANCWDAVVDPLRPQFYAPGVALAADAANQRSRGNMWSEGSGMMTSVTTVFPPGGPNCNRGNNNNSNGGIFSAASRHPGGCHVLMVDGAVRFVTSSIDSGDLTRGAPATAAPTAPPAGSQSPYGLWGALGTTRGREPRSIDEL